MAHSSEEEDDDDEAIRDSPSDEEETLEWRIDFHKAIDVLMSNTHKRGKITANGKAYISGILNKLFRSVIFDANQLTLGGRCLCEERMMMAVRHNLTEELFQYAHVRATTDLIVYSAGQMDFNPLKRVKVMKRKSISRKRVKVEREGSAEEENFCVGIQQLAMQQGYYTPDEKAIGKVNDILISLTPRIVYAACNIAMNNGGRNLDVLAMKAAVEETLPSGLIEHATFAGSRSVMSYYAESDIMPDSCPQPEQRIFCSGLRKLLREIHGIGFKDRNAEAKASQIISDVMNGIVNYSVCLASSKSPKVLTASDIENTVLAVLPGNMKYLAIGEGNKATLSRGYMNLRPAPLQRLPNNMINVVNGSPQEQRNVRLNAQFASPDLRSRAASLPVDSTLPNANEPSSQQRMSLPSTFLYSPKCDVLQSGVSATTTPSTQEPKTEVSIDEEVRSTEFMDYQEQRNVPSVEDVSRVRTQSALSPQELAMCRYLNTQCVPPDLRSRAASVPVDSTLPKTNELSSQQRMSVPSTSAFPWKCDVLQSGGSATTTPRTQEPEPENSLDEEVQSTQFRDYREQGNIPSVEDMSQGSVQQNSEQPSTSTQPSNERAVNENNESNEEKE